MKKQHLALIGGLVLVGAFAIGAYAYKAHRADKLKKMSQQEESPLSRSHAVSMGPADAKVVIVEFFDPGCETCRMFAGPVKSILAQHPNEIRLVKRYLPLHRGSDTMAQILEAARLQGKYWEVLQVMFDTQPEWASHHHPQPDKIWQHLPRAGVDVARIRKDMNDPKIFKILQQDIADAKTLGARKTPSFFVNGKPLPSFGFRQLKTLIASELKAKYGN